jgi:leucyl-tRNA synthetase
VGGKTRGRVIVARNAGEADVVAAARAEPQIAKFLEGKAVRKVVYVPNRLLNLVVG